MPPELNLDPAKLDLNHIIADREAICRVNLQRFEMEQIDAIIYEDTSLHVVAGYKDVRSDEFWVKGHMPALSAPARRSHVRGGGADGQLLYHQA